MLLSTKIAITLQGNVVSFCFTPIPSPYIQPVVYYTKPAVTTREAAKPETEVGVASLQ